MKRRILVVDDQRHMANVIKFNLEKEDFEVILSHDGGDAIKKAFDCCPDLILLDIILPKKDGFQVLKEIRKKTITPVIIVTSQEDEEHKVQGLDLGADDYITKPFGIKELVARVKANLRRLEYLNLPKKSNIIASEDLVIDISKYEVKKDGQVINLTLREFELLKFLALRSEKVFSREQLLEEVWGYEHYGDIRTVDVTIRRLREKVENQSGKYKHILTKRGVGYYFRRI
ncbi:transcriptional regulatory protein WalR [Gottschalkia purinilytica]|uniref:Transcriptional regulatory protein WalR n=1 Tax=Gottschalkia purinilytica TaxID=1503 RepID=A0A0L0W8I9_GOTPU|nr:response regulator [Gottschalkia purinilytica]KNF07590.1 transcriptional regulatory protein WalR [Gottschalkia purinilytica]